MKRCTQCKEPKPATPEYFWRDRTKRDGFCTRCRECIRSNSKLIMGAGPKKRCSECKRWYPPSTTHFYRDNGKRDGLTARCRICAALIARTHYQGVAADPTRKALAEQRRREWRKAHPERVQAYSRKYKQSPLGRMNERRYRKRRGFKQIFSRVLSQPKNESKP